MAPGGRLPTTRDVIRSTFRRETALTDEELRLVQTLEGQIAGLTLAVIRIAKVSADPATIAAELEVAGDMFTDDTARSKAAALMLRLMANAILQEPQASG
jgi:hypothetical protein